MGPRRNETHILYLSRKDVEEIDLNLSEILELVEKSFLEKGKGNSSMDPKHWYDWGGERFFSGMSAYTPTSNVAGVKWQSGVPENPARGLPYINGYLIINSLGNGLPAAIMDSTWITAKRTGAQTAITARYLAKEEPEILAMLGCGVQARTNLEALLLVFPGLKCVQAFDIRKPNLKAYGEFGEKLGVKVTACENQKDTITGADIIITAGPIHRDPSGNIEPTWLKEGVLAIPIDFDSYWKPEAIHAFDKFFVDDTPQILHFREQGTFFRNIPKIDADFGEIISGEKPGRESQSEKIMCMNLGVATEDMPVAAEIYQRAREGGIGVWLRR